jgi:hypothetical protein
MKFKKSFFYIFILLILCLYVNVIFAQDLGWFDMVNWSSSDQETLRNVGDGTNNPHTIYKNKEYNYNLEQKVYNDSTITDFKVFDDTRYPTISYYETDYRDGTYNVEVNYSKLDYSRNYLENVNSDSTITSIEIYDSRPESNFDRYEYKRVEFPNNEFNKGYEYYNKYLDYGFIDEYSGFLE